MIVLKNYEQENKIVFFSTFSKHSTYNKEIGTVLPNK